ncbi:MAG: winged helix-turn-helix domain-containing protein [Anaerolineae bacterium]
MRVLLVSEDAQLVSELSVALKAAKHQIVHRSDDHAVLHPLSEGVDMVLHDLGQADFVQWDSLPRWRWEVERPYIAIGPSHQSELAVTALRMGADDYVGRPLQTAELIARMEALVRRASMNVEPQHDPVGQRGQIALDMEARRVWVDGREVRLTPTEFRLLKVLVQRSGEPVSREDLVRQIWGKSREAGDTSLSLYIWNLRHKLEANPSHPRLIVTRWGLGYALQKSID